MTPGESIDEVRRCIGDPPANEIQTCEWAVVPLLRAAGYLPREIHAQARDPGDKLPDYTLLPASASEWFLEVKTWDAPLDGKPEIQATGYAHNAGKRWAALTNGRIWRVYDDHVPGVPDAKRIAEARLDEADFAEFLEAIGREAVTATGMERVLAWARTRSEKARIQARAEEERREREDRTSRERAARAEALAAILPGRLTSEGDELVQAMCAILAHEEALAGLTASEVAEHFRHATPTLDPPEEAPAEDAPWQPETPQTARGDVGEDGRRSVILTLERAGVSAVVSDRGIVTARITRDGRIVSRRIRVVASSERRFSLYKKWRDPTILLAYVWFATDPRRTEIVAMTYAEAVRVLDQKGHAKQASWRRDGWWSAVCGGEWLRFLEPYRMTTPEKLREKLLSEAP